MSLENAFNPQMLHLTQVKMSTRYDRDGNVYNKINAPKWLKDCRLSVELKNECTGVITNMKSDDESLDLISDYKLASFLSF